MNLFYVFTATMVLGALTADENILTNRARSSVKEPSPDRFNYFDIELLQERVRADNNNLVISPASVKVLLAMILEGSDGQTADQLRQALRIQESTNSHQQQLSDFIKSLQVHNPGYTVELGNRLFVSNKITLRKEYQEALFNHYDADVRQVDYSSPQITATTINDWVNDKTHGFIKRLVEPDSLNPHSKMMLVNAIYFKGKWKVPFDPDVTSIKSFYLQDDVCYKAFYMEKLGVYPYAYIEELNAQALALPYEGNKFTMLLVMPRDITGINQLMRDLPFSPLKTIVTKLVQTEVLVSIPRFKMDYSTDLLSSLNNVGILDMFGPNANLSRMLTSGELSYITNVFHKAKIEVNEEGSRAGAGTGAIAVPLLGKQFPRFHPNRPFLFFIRDVETGGILFEGRVNVPELASEMCFDLKPVQQPVRPTQGVTTQQSDHWSQQNTNITVHQPLNLNNPNSEDSRPYIIISENNKLNFNNQSIVKNGTGQNQNYAPNTNETRSGNRRPISNDKDAIQFYNTP